MNKVALIAGGLGLLYMAKYAANTALNLKHFKPSEFGIWWPMMDAELLLNLDIYRERLGVPVHISPAGGAIGRKTEKGLEGFDSQHNFLRWGKVQAVDVMPETDLQTAYNAARGLFTGIGAYPDWNPRAGLHLDMRSDRTKGNPALWSGRMVEGKQVYGALQQAGVFA